jgi:hypothetical protein
MGSRKVLTFEDLLKSFKPLIGEVVDRNLRGLDHGLNFLQTVSRD